MNYEGPGIYEHYKGDYYIAFGLGKLEHSEGEHVAYMTLDQEHQQNNWHKGYFCTFRPLNEVDGPDCWNSMVPLDTGTQDVVPRFKKVA